MFLSCTIKKKLLGARKLRYELLKHQKNNLFRWGYNIHAQVRSNYLVYTISIFQCSRRSKWFAHKIIGQPSARSGHRPARCPSTPRRTNGFPQLVDCNGKIRWWKSSEGYQNANQLHWGEFCHSLSYQGNAVTSNDGIGVKFAGSRMGKAMAFFRHGLWTFGC